MIKINLLPDVVLERRRRARIKWIANLALIGWCGLVLLVLLAAFGYNQWQSSRLESARAERDEVEAEAFSPENVEFRREALSVQSSLDGLVRLRDRRQLVTEFTDALQRNMPRDVRIVSLNYETGDIINIGGQAASYEAVSNFEHALKNSRPSSDADSNEPLPGYFENTSLTGANVAGQGRIRFQISTEYVAPSGSNTASADSGAGAGGQP